MSDSASGTQADSKRRGSSQKNAPGNLVLFLYTGNHPLFVEIKKKNAKE